MSAIHPENREQPLLLYQIELGIETAEILLPQTFQNRFVFSQASNYYLKQSQNKRDNYDMKVVKYEKDD